MKQLNYEEPGRPHSRPHNLSPAAEMTVMVVVALALLVPCVWQSRIAAGDIPSHVYNAWLATEVEHGRAQGLEVRHPVTNVLSDWALQRLLNLLGLVWAERIVCGVAVEILFWGAFAFAAVVAGRRCWVITPSLGMLAYGWIFELGLLNFYLATGLSLWLLVILWRPRRPYVWLAAPLALLALLAHPLPLAWAAAVLLYTHLLRRTPEGYAGAVFLSGAALLLFCQVALLHSFPAQWSLQDMVGLQGLLWLSGVGQFWLYGLKYMIPVAGIVVIWFLLFLERVDRGDLWRDPVLHLWGLCVAAVALLPSAIQFSRGTFSVLYFPQRVSFFAALLFCGMVAGVSHGRSLTRASSLLAAVFFMGLYLDMRSFNQVVGEIARLVADLPPRQRVVASLRDSGSLRLNGLVHVASAACVEQCFDYANYEPASRQFRVRTTGPNHVVAATPEAVHDLEFGGHVVTSDEEPLYSLCPPTGAGARFNLRRLVAGDKTCVVTVAVTPQF